MEFSREAELVRLSGDLGNVEAERRVYTSRWQTRHSVGYNSATDRGRLLELWGSIYGSVIMCFYSNQTAK